jgi:hypothetical protein
LRTDRINRRTCAVLRRLTHLVGAVAVRVVLEISGGNSAEGPRDRSRGSGIGRQARHEAKRHDLFWDGLIAAVGAGAIVGTVGVEFGWRWFVTAALGLAAAWLVTWLLMKGRRAWRAQSPGSF